MASMVLISVIAILVILCSVLIVRMILGHSKDQGATAASQTAAISQAIIDFQSAQTRQLGELLDRHSSDLSKVLSAQSGYINQFLNGPVIQADSPIHPQPEPPDLDLADPANWSDDDQMAAFPRSMQSEIHREQMEQEMIDRLNAPSHPIRTYPGVPVVIPGLSSEEAMAQANGSWTMYDGPAD